MMINLALVRLIRLQSGSNPAQKEVRRLVNKWGHHCKIERRGNTAIRRRDAGDEDVLSRPERKMSYISQRYLTSDIYVEIVTNGRSLQRSPPERSKNNNVILNTKGDVDLH